MSILQMDGLDLYGAVSGTSQTFKANGYNPSASLTLGTSYGKNSGSLGAVLYSSVSQTAVWISKPIQPDIWHEATPYDPTNFVILGFAFRFTSAPTAAMTIAKVGDHEVAVNTDFTMMGDGNLSDYQIEIGIWNYMEVEINEQQSAFRIWMNDRLIYDVPLQEATVNFDKWHIMALYKSGGTNSQQYLQVDDIYLMDGSGATNNTRLGKVHIVSRVPTSDIQVGFTRSGGTTSYSLVDDTTPDNDSTYVYAADPDTTDLYANTSALTVVDEFAVVAIAVQVSARMTEPDSLSVGAVIKSGTTIADGSRMLLKAAEYTSERAIFQVDPATGAQWSPTAVQNLAFGQKILDRLLE